jgi:hypothetical protein
MAVSPLRAGDFQGRDKLFAVTYPLMLDHRRIWVFGTRPSTRRAPGLISDESMALERHFSLIDRHDSTASSSRSGCGAEPRRGRAHASGSPPMGEPGYRVPHQDGRRGRDQSDWWRGSPTFTARSPVEKGPTGDGR